MSNSIQASEQEKYYDLLNGFSQTRTERELLNSLRDYFKIDYLKAVSVLNSWRELANIRQVQIRESARARYTVLMSN